MRVVVTQFATSLNGQENLATCMRVINKAAMCNPSLIVLPEYCNTQPWYVDHNQAWQQALAVDGVFLQTIAEQAKTHNCYIVLNVTLRRDLAREHTDGSIKSNISVTTCLFSPQGELIHQADKQGLEGHENDFFINASKLTQPVETPFGQIGFIAGTDSTSFEAARALATNGAQLICNALNSFVSDESTLHDPARACENNIFLVSANKIGPLVPSEQSSKDQSVPTEYLIGKGQSQIVGPDGQVLANIANQEEGLAFADIDLAGTGFNKLLRPDGTEAAKQLRIALYREKNFVKQQSAQVQQIPVNQVPETANAAIFATYKSNQQAIEDVCHYIENNLSDIIQLPELFFIADKNITHDDEKRNQIEKLSHDLIKQISLVLRPFQYVCTSLVIDGLHQAVLISEEGLYATQQQLHFCNRYQWTTLGDELNIIELALEQGRIKLAMLTGDDAQIPEVVKVAALHDIQVLLVPFDIQAPHEVEFSLIARATENRICLVAASREKSFSNLPVNNVSSVNSANTRKIKQHKSTGLIVNLTPRLALLNQWETAKFDGYSNKPLIKHQHGKITKAVIFPIAAINKTLSNKEDISK